MSTMTGDVQSGHSDLTREEIFSADVSPDELSDETGYTDLNNRLTGTSTAATAKLYRIRRIVASVAAAAVVSGGAVTLVAGSASALPRSSVCESLYTNYLQQLSDASEYLGFYTTDWLEGNYGAAADDLSSYNDHMRQAYDWLGRDNGEC